MLDEHEQTGMSVLPGPAIPTGAGYLGYDVFQFSLFDFAVGNEHGEGQVTAIGQCDHADVVQGAGDAVGSAGRSGLVCYLCRGRQQTLDSFWARR